MPKYTVIVAKLTVLLLVLLAPAVAIPKWKLDGYPNKAALLADSSVFTGEEDPETVKKMFKEWKEYMRKSYSNPHEEEVALKRFQENLKKAAAINKDTSRPWLAGPTQFADLDFDTFASLYLSQVDPSGVAGGPSFQGGRRMLCHDGVVDPLAPSSRQLHQTIETDVDWAARGKVSPVRDQGQCGSCWAFAGTLAVESAYYIGQDINADLSQVDLAEQQIVSCANKAGGFGSMGCKGGWTSDAINYVAKNFLTTEALYPYTASNSRCNNKFLSSLPSGSSVKLASYTIKATPYSQAALMAAVAQQPVAISFRVVDSFYLYESGLYYEPNCGGWSNHAMLDIGYHWTGSELDSYWIIQNSWGTGWGEAGRMKLRMVNAANGPCNVHVGPEYPTKFFLHTLA